MNSINRGIVETVSPPHSRRARSLPNEDAGISQDFIDSRDVYTTNTRIFTNEYGLILLSELTLLY